MSGVEKLEHVVEALVREVGRRGKSPSIYHKVGAGDVLPERLPIANVEGACATGSFALHMAWKDVLSGQNDLAIAIGVEKPYDPPPCLFPHERLRFPSS